MDFIINITDGAADTVKCRAGIVTDLILCQNAAADFLKQRCQRFQSRKKYIQGVSRQIVAVFSGIGFCTPGDLQ